MFRIHTTIIYIFILNLRVDVYTRQILTRKVDPNDERVNY